MIAELALNVIAPLPYLYDVKYYEYNKQFDATAMYDLNDLLLFFSFIRVYILARFALVVTQFMNPRSLRICMMNGCEADAMFAVRSIMKQRPYTILFVSLVVSTVVFSY